jgi:hypothetical protein
MATVSRMIIENEEMKQVLAQDRAAMDQMLDCINSLKADVAYLLARSMRAGSCDLGGERDTGIAANSLVAIAYGRIPIEAQEFPSDRADLAAVARAYEKLPRHRQTKLVWEALHRALKFVEIKETQFAGRS